MTKCDRPRIVGLALLVGISSTFRSIVSRTAPSEGRVLFCLALGWLLSSFTIRFSLSCFFLSLSLFFFFFFTFTLSLFLFFLCIPLRLSLSKCCSTRGGRVARFTSIVRDTILHTISDRFFLVEGSLRVGSAGESPQDFTFYLRLRVSRHANFFAQREILLYGRQ